MIGPKLRDGRSVLGLAQGAQEVADIARGGAVFCDRFKQLRHGRALVNEHADEAPRLSQRSGRAKRHAGSWDVTLDLEGQRLQDQDLDHASRPLACFRRFEEAPQESEYLTHGVGGTLALCAGQQQPGQGDVSNSRR